MLLLRSHLPLLAVPPRVLLHRPQLARLLLVLLLLLVPLLLLVLVLQLLLRRWRCHVRHLLQGLVHALLKVWRHLQQLLPSRNRQTHHLHDMDQYNMQQVENRNMMLVLVHQVMQTTGESCFC